MTPVSGRLGPICCFSDVSEWFHDLSSSHWLTFVLVLCGKAMNSLQGHDIRWQGVIMWALLLQSSTCTFLCFSLANWLSAHGFANIRRFNIMLNCGIIESQRGHSWGLSSLLINLTVTFFINTLIICFVVFSTPTGIHFAITKGEEKKEIITNEKRESWVVWRLTDFNNTAD